MKQDNSGDVSTTTSIVLASYALLSGRAGERRDWDRFRALYAPGARLIPIEAREDGTRAPRPMTPDEFITSRTPFFDKTDFFEWETGREELRYGTLAHVWSSYEAGHELNGPRIRKGTNSFQLWHDGSRWWILSVSWDAVEALNHAGR